MATKTKKNTKKDSKTKKTEAFIKGKIGEIVNDTIKTPPSNEFVVVTKEDNLVHNYFHSCETYWDANDCLSRIKLKFPKASEEETKYWIGYRGEVWCYMGNNISLRNIKRFSEYNIQGIESPFFVGTLDITNEYYNEVEVALSNIGGRFKQAIPDQFRQSYINNQNVRDAFQAICEFLGVYYICPPKQENDSGVSDTDSNENDPNDKTQREGQTGQAIKNSAKKTIKNQTQQGDASSQDAQNTQDNTSENSNANNQPAMQGYDQVNFDGNGAITYNNAVIEESPDMAEILPEIEDTTFDKYIDDDTEVLTDVTDFLNGKIFEEIHPNYLDYNAITIEPKSSASSQMSEIDSGAGTENGQNGENGQSGTDSSSGTGTGSSTT